MIQNFSLRRLHNGEFLTFTTQFLGIINNPQLPASVQSARGQLEAFCRSISAAHVGQDESVLSRERRELDAARDAQYAGLVALVQAYCSSKDAAKRAAAEQLLDRMNDYGTVSEVTRQGDGDESADINGILRDLATPALATAATLIGAGDWIDELRHLQAAFEQKSMERNADRSERLEAQPENIDALRVKATAAYRSLCSKINAYNNTEEGAEPWPGIIARINTLIGETRNMLAGRAGRAAASAAAAAASTEAPGA
jgi:hypothetical protein